MEKNKYLEVRKKLVSGNVDMDGMLLFFEFWNKNKKPEYPEISFQEFSAKFTQFLNINYPLIIDGVISNFDRQYAVTTVINKKGELLTVI